VGTLDPGAPLCYRGRNMKLGEMLVKDGRLTQAQVDAAVAQQARVGGRLGTVMVEMRLVDADTLTVYLGLELGIPIATRAALDRAKRAAVRLLTPELAERFVCVPIVVQDRQLIAAMKDPHDLLALDELASATGCRIIPRVAPEVRLYYYLERYYGVPRPDRFRRMGDAVVAGAPRGTDFVEPPPPPLPGLPPRAKRPVVAPPLPAPQLRVVGATEEDDDLALELAADSAETAAVQPIEAEGSTPMLRAVAAEAVGAEKVQGETIAIGEALERMAKATIRGEIADAIVAHARGIFDAAALLVVKDELAFGWRGFGRELDVDRIETLLVPLGAPSIFRQAIEEADLFVGAAPPTALHAHVFKVLRTHAPRQAVVVPISIRDRVVNLLYGQREGEKELSEAALAGLRQLAKAAADAYVRLIALHKQGG
jgi:hypothetical protein